MRLVINPGKLRRILLGTQRTLFAVAILTLGYCCFVFVDAWAFQQREQSHLERLLNSASATSSVAQKPARTRSPKSYPVAANAGLIGRILVPRLGFSAIVVEGTSSVALRRAVGHIEGTALPGEPGNIGFSGHRDTFFLPLRDIRDNDKITVITLRGEFSYRVASITIVSPSDVAVLGGTSDEILTLVTCYPFDFVGPAPERFIVRAERIGDPGFRSRRIPVTSPDSPKTVSSLLAHPTIKSAPQRPIGVLPAR